MITIFIGNLPNDTKQSQAKKLFSRFGEVAALELIVPPAGRPFQGYGFVEMEAEPGRAAIAELDGSIYRGAILCVAEATPAQLAQRAARDATAELAVPLDEVPPSNLLRRYYQVISVEKAPGPMPDAEGDWCRYELQSGSSRITGLHRGTLEEVTAYATECAAAFNLRSIKGKSPKNLAFLRRKKTS